MTTEEKTVPESQFMEWYNKYFAMERLYGAERAKNESLRQKIHELMDHINTLGNVSQKLIGGMLNVAEDALLDGKETP